MKVNLSNFTTNTEVDADITKQKENRGIIYKEVMSTIKKSAEVSVHLQASKVRGNIVSKL